MFKIKGSKNKSLPILESEIPEQFEEKIQKIMVELLDLISKYKAKRNLWEVKLKENNDPRRVDFYAIIARLSMLDMMVADLDQFKELLSKIPSYCFDN